MTPPVLDFSKRILNGSSSDEGVRAGVWEHMLISHRLSPPFLSISSEISSKTVLKLSSSLGVPSEKAMRENVAFPPSSFMVTISNFVTTQPPFVSCGVLNLFIYILNKQNME